MTTILQSCLETQFIEKTTVKLKVAPNKTLELSRSSNHESCGWSFLQVLSNVSSTPKETMEEENVYVHPVTKQYSSSSSSSSRLSEKSLELCTENLGSETGSDDHSMDISILSLSPSSNSPSSSENSWLKQEEKLPQEVESSSNSKHNKVVNNSRKFPPPLTTISGSNSLQFRPHREDGRLVIQAVEAPLKHTYFEVERSHGRLRISFLKDRATMVDSQLTRTEKINEVDDSEDDYDGVDLDIGDNDYQDQDYYQLGDDDEDEEMVAHMIRRDMDDNIFNVEAELGRENFQRLTNGRCNEGVGHGNKGLTCNWQEPLWVATS